MLAMVAAAMSTGPKTLPSGRWGWRGSWSGVVRSPGVGARASPVSAPVRRGRRTADIDPPMTFDTTGAYATTVSIAVDGSSGKGRSGSPRCRLRALRHAEVRAFDVVDRLMPGEMLAKARAQPPTQRFGRGLDGRLEAVEAVPQASRLERVQAKRAERLTAASQVAHDVVVQAPVGGAKPRQVAEVECAAGIALAKLDGVLDDAHDVAQVVVVQGRPLQLDEQDVARRDGVGLELQASPQIDAVVQLEGVDVEIDAIVVVRPLGATAVTALPKELSLAARRGHRHLTVLLPA